VEGRALYTKRFPLMGGVGSIRFVDHRGRAHADAIADAAHGEAVRIERKFSRYLPSSVVSEIGRNAGRTPVAVDSETERLVGEALELAELTSGRFDPTSGVLRAVWDFRAQQIPSAEAIAEILPLVDRRLVATRDRTVFLRRAGMELDLGGVGKEYAVDRVAETLEAAGVESAIVNFAGDVRTVGGRGDGRPWSIGVADPDSPDRCRFAIRLAGGGGVATSGDYERGFVRNGIRYHHLLDARTGMPASGVRSVTAVAKTTSAAGRAATAAFLCGPEAGVELLRRLPGIEGAIIAHGGAILATPGMVSLSDLPGSLYAAYPRV
jgi:thiamine biosynthesis lipoprotein